MRDIKPQFLVERVAEDTLNTYNEEEMELPFDLDEGIGIEILKVWYNITKGQPDITTAIAHSQLQVQVCKASQTSILAGDNPDIVVPELSLNYLPTEVGTSANTHSFITDHWPKEIDVSDGDGNGIIFVGPRFYLGIKGSGMAAASGCTIRILYRLLKVPRMELLGMLAQ